MNLIQRSVICMIDGFGYDYYETSQIPNMKKIAENGFHKKAKAVFPTLTNTNNFSIICASWPNVHGVTTNCYYDETTNSMKYFEDPDFIKSPTIFKIFKDKGIKTALLTCKEKTIKLAGRDADIAIAAESPSEDIIKRYGNPPSIYSSDVNYWIWNVAIDILKNRKDIKLLYIHTTDYPMHKWEPNEIPSLNHMLELDRLLGEALEIAPDAQFLITADHGMNFKKKCINLLQICKVHGIDLKFFISPVADRLLEHHKGYGGVAYLYLKNSTDIYKTINFISTIDGVENILTREECSKQYNLMPERIGDLVVLADNNTVFGETNSLLEILPSNYRNHGSLHEQDIPIIIYGSELGYPEFESITYNFEITKWLLEKIFKGN